MAEPSNAPLQPPVPSGKRIPRKDVGFVGLDFPYPGTGVAPVPCVLMEPQHIGYMTF